MAHSDGHADHHIIPFKTLLNVFLALVALTVLTVLAAWFDLGPLEIPVALGIAAAKATLVVMYFMALKYDKPVNSMVFIVGTSFVGVFLIFTLFDTVFRGDLGNVGARTITEEERELEQLQQREPDPEQLRVTPSDFGEEEDEAGTDADSEEP